MNPILLIKKIFRNKFAETLFFGLIFGWVLYRNYENILSTLFEEQFDLTIFLLTILQVGLVVFLFYLFFDSYMRNFGLIAMAYKEYKNGQYRNAIKKYDLVLKIFRWNGNYLNARGNCYYKMRNWKRAIDDYSKAIKLEPDAAYIYENRSNAYKFMGFKSHAKEDLKKYNQLK